jgi:hypothetical protein
VEERSEDDHLRYPGSIDCRRQYVEDDVGEAGVYA